MGEPGSAQSALLFQGTDSIQWKRTGSDEDQRIPENRSYFLPTLGQRNGREPGAEIPSGYQTEAWKNLKGMLSMVTIITAMASKAPFTFLDEPVAGLDVIAREQFYQLLLDEYTETGRTFVVSTHIIEEASDIFEEVIIVDKGEILLKENTQEL